MPAVKPRGEDSLEDFFVPTGLDPDHDDAAYFDDSRGSNRDSRSKRDSTTMETEEDDDERQKPSHRKAEQGNGRARWDDAAEARGHLAFEAIKAGGNSVRGKEKARLVKWLADEKYHEKWGVDKSTLSTVCVLFYYY